METTKQRGLDTIQGNILSMLEGIICHQVNCKGKMGAGLALRIRQQWPQVYADYMKRFAATGLYLGDVIWTQVGANLWVASLCGQDNYGREKGVVYTDYKALETCLGLVAASGVQPVFIPKGMSCTLAGGDWDTVCDIISKVIPDACIVELTERTVIDSFAGQYHFLSNFEDSPIQMALNEDQQIVLQTDKLIFKTVEHYYQAMKSLNPVIWWAISQLGTPGAAKRAGNGKPFTIRDKQYNTLLRPDWDVVKDNVMEQGLMSKFQYEHLRKALLATGNAEIIEGNTWHDNYWGNCTCPKCSNKTGLNVLGKLLMKVRQASKQ